METNTLSSFFRGDYMPHGHCYLWQPHILWTNVISDFLIAFAYFSLPVAIMIFSAKRKDIGFQGVFWLFSLFILCCGITHIFGIWTIWHGVYGYHGLSKAVTAVVSVATAVYVYKLMPAAITLPTVAQFDEVKEQLNVNQATVDALESELANQKLVKFILDSIPVSTLMLDKDSNIVFYNQTFKDEFAHYLQPNLSTLSLFDIVKLEQNTSEQMQQYLSDDAQLGQEKLVINSRITSVKGYYVPVELSLDRAEYEGQVVTLIALKNLTEFTQVKNELLESHQRLSRAISATEDGIWEWNIKNNHVEYSPKLMELIGKEDVSTPCFDDWLSHIHPDYKDKVNNAIETHFNNKTQFIVEYVGRDKYQRYSWFVSVGNSIFDNNGEPLLMSGSLRNIDPTKRLEKLYQEKEGFLNAIYNGTSHAVWVVSITAECDFKFEEFNDTACQWTRTNPSAVIGRTLTELAQSVFKQSVADKIRERYEHCVKSKKPFDYVEHIKFDDVSAWYNATLYPVFDQNNKVTAIVGTAIDITSRKQSEIALEENQVFLETIINSTVCGLYLFDITHNVNVRINQRYTDILGYNIDDINAIADFMQLFHPDDVPHVETHINNVITDEGQTLAPLTYRFKHKEGHWVWCYSVDCIVKRNKSGQPELMLGTFVDITEQTTLLQKLKESNEYLERFAFVASHDLQEPLRKITAFSSLLSNRLAPIIANDQEAEYEFSRLTNAAERMKTMIKDILKLSRINTSAIAIKQCQLQEVVNVACDRLQFLIEQSSAEIHVSPDNANMMADPTLFVQVLQNLIGNAIKFAKTDQDPIIDIRLRESDHETIITIRDNGIGIEEPYLKSIFEPFKKLHANSEYEGSGIGLAICQQIINVHEGQIYCESEQGQGTTFTLYLPKQGAFYA
ncbi:PAS domain-containing protein [Thalassotalea sp. 1_MG-2023]|uniref:PAS domain-containing sensor histidine kinase n=1 Tax=Thalassotalea sp. 1_MG-2023 TaxID=3062680 RepID=UPI0026E3D04C|nr:PAS domain-containing sensor histidine kinase [Thalassotalea sp. 1_MG-2023]MDO6425770.1 PAS domain-containing protein [Thalassotalea sp. 1_MG-2023]